MDLIKINKLKITGVVDTHQHADHVSATRELARVTNSKLHVSKYEKYNFDANYINEDTKLNIGDKEITIIHTPGHTIGSLCLIIDMEYMFSGDVISFNGVGRPDLHENSITLAYKLYNTLHNKIMNLPEHIKIFPAHQDSEYLINCDKNKIKYITIKDIKENKLFCLSKNDFVNKITHHQIQKPSNYENIIEINSGRSNVVHNKITELESGSNMCSVRYQDI